MIRVHIGSLLIGILLGAALLAGYVINTTSKKVAEQAELIHSQQVKITELQGKIDSDLRLLREIRRKHAHI